MRKTVQLLESGFESSSGLTPEFAEFFKVFKKEFTKEMETVGAKDFVFNRGHFYVSGFFTIGTQAWYFSIPDVRGMSYGFFSDPDSCMNKLLYREAKDYKDYTGGMNRYAKIRFGMADEMCWYFKII